MKKNLSWVIWPALTGPLIYLAVVWNNIQGNVPLHFNIKGEADGYGDKNDLLSLTIILGVASTFTYLLLTQIHKIDPKRQSKSAYTPATARIGLITAIFLSLLNCFIIYTAVHNTGQMHGRIMVILLGAFFAALGNYMHNIKPNYFAGFRLPWTLESEDNWKKTHLLGGRLWFGGGILIAIAGFLFKQNIAFGVMIGVIAFITIVPVIYSFLLYKKGFR